jgi:tRNA pseudouridine55 synthase
MNGKKLYEYARENIQLPKEIQSRPVSILRIDIVRFQDKIMELSVECGGGVYMRSLVHDLTLGLGTYGHMVALKRIQQGSIVLDRDTVELQALKSHRDINWL